jgi:hypothetical protein
MAGRATLAYFGADDIMLVGEPEITYFLEKYTGQVPFAKRLEVLSFDTDVRFGTDNIVKITKRGDLITNIYLKFLAPIIPSAFCDSVMTYMIEYVEILYDGQMVERLYGEYIEMMFDLKTPKGKQTTLQYLSGRVYPATSATVNSEYTLPLPFSCFQKGFEMKDALIQFRVILKKSSLFTIPVYEYTLPINMQILVEYAYLGFELKRDIQVYEQVQRVEFYAAQGVNNVRLQLGFMNPVKELFLVIQNINAFGFDFTSDGSFSSDQTSYTNGTSEQLSNLVLKLNNADRVDKYIGVPIYLRVIQAMEYHTRVPDRKFYMYSFSLDPENALPCGQVNMSRINNQILELTLNASTQSRFIRVYAVSYNFLKDGKVLFPNEEDYGQINRFPGN